MERNIGYLTYLVDDYDRAISWFTGTLGFTLVEDRVLTPEKRWVLVSPSAVAGTCLLLARAATPSQRARIGDQTGGRVFLFLHTDNFERDYRLFLERGVEFLETPRKEAYGIVAVFRDLYGNTWDLLEPAGA